MKLEASRIDEMLLIKLCSNLWKWIKRIGYKSLDRAENETQEQHILSGGPGFDSRNCQDFSIIIC